MSYLAGFLSAVIQLIFGLMIFLVLGRFILQIVRADFYNPLSQFFIRATDPMLRPMRRVIPGLLGLDMAAIVLLIILQGVELVLTHVIRGIGLHNPVLFLSELVGSLIQHAAWLFLICILIVVLSSWINPGAYQHPLVKIARSISSPILRPARRLIPPINNIDFSPIVAFIIIYAILYLVAAPLIDIAHRPF